MNQSEQINELVAALAKAQGQMKPATFNKVNPHFKNRYADFTSCMDACREPLSSNGLAITQMPSSNAEGKLVLLTMIAHSSGQWIRGEFPLITAKMDSQGVGSAMTYAKRYSLCGMLGLVADEDIDADDDGEKAMGRGKVNETKQDKIPSPSVSKDLINEEEYKELLGLLKQVSRDYKSNLEKTLQNQGIGSYKEMPSRVYKAQKPLILEHIKNNPKDEEIPF